MKTIVAIAKLLHSGGFKIVYSGCSDDELDDAIDAFYNSISEFPKLYDFTYVIVHEYQDNSLVNIYTVDDDRKWEGDRFNLMRDPFKLSE